MVRAQFAENERKANKQLRKNKMSRKALDVFEKLVNNLLDFQRQPPEKLILTKDIKRIIWKLMLSKEDFTAAQHSKLWLLASGAANTMSMEML